MVIEIKSRIGHSCIFNTRKFSSKIASFTEVYLLGVNSQLHTAVPTKNQQDVHTAMEGSVSKYHGTYVKKDKTEEIFGKRFCRLTGGRQA